MRNETTIWLDDKTTFTAIGKMIGSMRVASEDGWDHQVVFHSVLAVQEIEIWKRLRDSCDEQIRRLTQAAVEAAGPSEADLKLADKIIASGDLDDFVRAPALVNIDLDLVPENNPQMDEMPVLERIQATVRIPAMDIDDDTPF